MSKENLKNSVASVPLFVIPSSVEQAQELVMPDKDYKKGLESVVKKGLGFREEVQFLGLHCALAMFASGNNTDHANQLYAAVGNGLSEVAKNQLKDWLTENFPVRYTKIKNGEYSFRMDKENKEETIEQWRGRFNFENAVNNPWYTIKAFTQNQVSEMFGAANFLKSIETLIAKAEKKLEEGKVAVEDRDQIRSYVSMLKDIVPAKEQDNQGEGAEPSTGKQAIAA